MKVAGVIAEYNPFHNGHKYQLDKIRQDTDADYIITAISGNFMQRGEPAIIDKYNRTQMALSGGADLIIELPTAGACSSAEYFARTGVGILNSTGVVDFLCYGVENKNHELFKKIVALMADNNFFNKMQTEISCQVKEGLSYPAAREYALRQFLSDEYGFDTASLKDFLSLPNNILALEYERAMHIALPSTNGHTMQGHPILRVGSGYNDEKIESEFASATGIRQLINIRQADSNFSEKLKKICPDSTSRLLLDNINKLVFPDSLSSSLYYKLLLYKNTGYETFADCTPELSHKISNNLYRYENYQQFCTILKSRNLTLSRIRRVLVHILLEIKQNDYTLLRNSFYAPYIRILGFKKNASELLHEIKEKASAPIITKVADASDILSSDAAYLFEKDIFASDLYRSLTFPASSNYNEFTKGIIIM
ncbi:MAG: nucleotidyltransferase family protein [Agathobacter sp.]|nr:nucleotidyltransferase family protein [Agathobacter sp.]